MLCLRFARSLFLFMSWLQIFMRAQSAVSWFSALENMPRKEGSVNLSCAALSGREELGSHKGSTSLTQVPHQEPEAQQACPGLAPFNP